jgi:DNA-binding transcriptional ArsR family regulator
LSEKIVRESLIVLHPVRWKIYQTLKKKGEPMYIDEIAKATKEDRRLISYHLSTLEDNSFVDSEFKIIQVAKSKGKAGRFYKLTSKADEILPELAKILET